MNFVPVKTIVGFLFLACVSTASATDYHVSALRGDDANAGSSDRPFKTISAAAQKAMPGDTVLVHAGVYRERVAPPRGGTDDAHRITYAVAPGEKAVITGSEVVKGWKKVGDDVWEVVLPDAFFGDFNPYADLIRGDWFISNGRDHHTGGVYLDDEAMFEAARLDDLSGKATAGGHRPNLAWLRPEGAKERIAATAFAARSGGRPAPCDEGGECIGYLTDGCWLRYDNVDFGERSERVELRCATPLDGGRIELRDGGPEGELLGSCRPENTGDWQAWRSMHAVIRPVSGKKNLCLVFRAVPQTASLRWFGKVTKDVTTIRAQFPGRNPNDGGVEIGVRKTLFSPDKPGIDRITVRGFVMRNAATNWAPPSAAQIGAISAYWCKGWVIEDNEIYNSRCSGIALGKYGDKFDNTNKAGSADPYTACVRRALADGWSRETVGSHIVRRNRIHHCGQAGIVGSMGCAFSRIEDNEVHDIHIGTPFAGWEIAGIKFHGAVDTVVSGNHVYRCGGSGGLWLDWMAQGARVVGNLFHDNSGDIFSEVNHGPTLFANNILLSSGAFTSWSHSQAVVHNLIPGRLGIDGNGGRRTPYFLPNSVDGIKVDAVPLGDARWFNNILGCDLSAYDKLKPDGLAAGNVFGKGGKPSRFDVNPLLLPSTDIRPKLEKKTDGWYLVLATDPAWKSAATRPLVTTALLGEAAIVRQKFTNPDGSAMSVDTDYFGKKRDAANPFPGPFETPVNGEVKVWPK